MKLQPFIIFAMGAPAALALQVEQRAAGQVLTAVKVYHTIIDQSPYLVERTTTTVWTEGTDIPYSDLPTAAPTPTVTYDST